MAMAGVRAAATGYPKQGEVVHDGEGARVVNKSGGAVGVMKKHDTVELGPPAMEAMLTAV
jgi:hypothetical protein